MRKSLLLALSLLFGASSPVMAAEPAPTVMVSIKPLHSLVALVMKGAGQPGLLVSGVNSPHDYALKPSDMRVLEKAALVVWVGPDFENWLVKPLERLPGRHMAMTSLPGMQLLPTREGGAWDPHHHEGEAHHEGHDDHDEIDGHLWLDVDNAAHLVVAVAEELARLDPSRADLYRANAAETRARLTRLDGDLKARLAPLAGKPYVVFHDAHQYFEARYGLTPAGAMTVDPERPLKAKRLAELRERLKGAKAACVFREPRFGDKAARNLAQAAGVGVGELDPEGTLADPGPDAYFSVMEGLARSLADCLSAR